MADYQNEMLGTQY